MSAELVDCVFHSTSVEVASNRPLYNELAYGAGSVSEAGNTADYKDYSPQAPGRIVAEVVHLLVANGADGDDRF
jgi:hypothetical protein